MKKHFTGRRFGEVRTFVSLRAASRHSLDCAKETNSGSYYACMSCIVFAAFSFEAYLNHVGSRTIPLWDLISRIPYHKKLDALSMTHGFSIDFEDRPFKTIRELFQIRNKLAHGKTESIDEPFTANADPNRQELTQNLTDIEKYMNIGSAERAYEDVTAAIDFINKNPKAHENELWSHGTRGYMVRDASA